MNPRKVVSGAYELWLPSENVLNQGTGFLFPTDQTTLTIPSTAGRVVTVGAYNALTFAYADFSERGYTRGARALPGFEEYPNPQMGYGALREIVYYCKVLMAIWGFR